MMTLTRSGNDDLDLLHANYEIRKNFERIKRSSSDDLKKLCRERIAAYSALIAEINASKGSL